MKKIVIVLLLILIFIYSSSAEEVIKYRRISPTFKATVQGIPIPVSSDLVEKHIGFGTSLSRWNSFAISFFKDFKVSSKGNNLDVNDEICVGDALNIENLPLKAEWFSKGGPHDSPPVLFVDDLTDIVDKIDEGVYKTKTYGTFVCAFMFGIRKREWGSAHNCIVKAQTICEANCNLTGEGIERLENRFVVRKSGEIEIKMRCEPKCIIFVDRPKDNYTVIGSNQKPIELESELESAYGYMALCGFENGNALCPISGEFAHIENTVEEYKRVVGVEEVFNVVERSDTPTISKTFRIKALPLTKGPEINIKPYLPKKISSRFIGRLEIENIGDTGAYIENIWIDNANFKVLYLPKKIEPGEKSEIILEIAPYNKGLKFDMDYTAETLGCFENKEFSLSMNLIEGEEEIPGMCRDNGDCKTGEICCVGSCRPSNKGICDDIDGDGEPDTWVEV